ncbi:hypothetical protein [Inquilinus sp. OTU3971]
MAKGQKRKNREIRKPKQAGKPVVHGATMSLLGRVAAAGAGAGDGKKKS